MHINRKCNNRFFLQMLLIGQISISPSSARSSLRGNRARDSLTAERMKNRYKGGA